MTHLARRLDLTVTSMRGTSPRPTGYARVVGVVAAIAAVGACSSDSPKAPPSAPVVVDAGALPICMDAGPPPVALVVDAGVIAVVDAGTAAHLEASAPSSVKSGVFDRVLVKPKDAALTKDEAVETAQKATHALVVEAHKSARTWFLLTFKPTSPARTAADQRKIIAMLQASGAFSAVEGDGVMTVK